MAKSQLRNYVFTPGLAGLGTVKIQGKYDLNQLLLITNVAKGTILYNFADPTYAGTGVSYSRVADSNFPKVLDGNDGITTITFVGNTSGMTTSGSPDQLQIFVESPEQTIRPWPMGTDAFERMRTSTPTSMLDADFEYGLQPTKWQTISTMRGYPSIYEIPGTDTSVTSVTTDYSGGTGIGESLITINTLSAHGFTAGTPITVKGYLNTITGFSRAEGSFIIFDVPTTTSLRYYATAVVGTSAGQEISTIYTQLRKGAFYTGSSIGSPVFTTTGGSGSAFATVTVTYPTAHGLVPSDTVNVSITSAGSNHAFASGPFFVESTPTPTSFTYTSRAYGAIAAATTTLSTVAITGTAGQFSCTAATLLVNQPVTISGTFGGTGSIPSYVNSTTYYIIATNGSTTFTLGDRVGGTAIVTTVGTPTGLTYTINPLVGVVYARPDCFYVHRPFDGGVQLGVGGPAHGAGAVRQSKKYIRYQSGKAINYNTGGLFAPNFDIRSMTASATTVGSTVTIITDDQDHGLQVGAVVTISGAQYPTDGYNGTYTVASIVDERTFTYTALLALGSTTALLGTPSLVSLKNWYGSVVRAGTYDDQNGMFLQFDGKQFAAVRRSSTFQLAGTIAVNTDSNAVTGTNTRFTTQLVTGDRIVIRGMTHVVSGITSDTVMTVTPDYRGATNIVGVKALLTKDYVVPQSQWNMDRCDGTGGASNPSGYLIDQSKMQMIGLQWTWYGAGFVDWMLRGPEGKYITVHRLRGNNLNTEAYMRSGNQPVRYEVLNENYRTYLPTNISSTATTIVVADTTYFPSSGTLLIENELINYSSTSSNAFVGCTRAGTFSLFAKGQNRTFSAGTATSHSTNTGVILVSQTATPIISHWGSAFLQDGGFDTDRGYIFNYQATNISISTKKTTAFAIRLAPSVSNAIVGDLGVRELINRAQLLLQGIEITAGGSTNTNSAIVIEGVLNPQNYPTPIANITWSGLNNSTYGGQPSFAQVAAGVNINFDNSFSLATTVTSTAPIGSTLIPTSNTTGIAIGDDISSTTITDAFQGNTKIVNFVANTSITISTPLVKALVNGNNITISRNTYAVPGETIFSFVSSPANKDSLDLEKLKELTNTPIGGRGTFPNGPDVLMINVYLTQGSPINSNLVLRWGEAQA